MPRRKPIHLDDRVPLRLSRRQHRLLIDEVMVLSDLDDKLRLGTVDEEGVVLRLTLAEADELADCVAFAANHAKSTKLERELDGVYGRIVELLRMYTDQDEAPPSALDALLDELSADGTSGEGRLDRQINGELIAAVTEAAGQLEAELGGLSLVEAMRLCGSDWEDPSGAVRLNEELTLAELQGAPMLLNARLFIRAVADAGSLKATAKGNLTRKFVASMLDRLHCEPGHADSVRAVNKVINEADFWPLHIVRVIVGLARLVRRTKGVFRTTKKGQALLPEEKAGALYALLFRTHFRKFNLAYLDRLAEIHSLQATVGFSLFMVGRHADRWVKPEKLAPLVLFPVAKAELATLPPWALGPWSVESRILSPLVSFGLLERRELPSEHRWMKPYEVRKTKLFDRFLQFDVGDVAGPTWFLGPH